MEPPSASQLVIARAGFFIETMNTFWNCYRVWKLDRPRNIAMAQPPFPWYMNHWRIFVGSVIFQVVMGLSASTAFLILSWQGDEIWFRSLLFTTALQSILWEVGLTYIPPVFRLLTSRSLLLDAEY